MTNLQKRLRELCSQEEWNDYKWQLRNRITDYNKLKTILKLSAEEEAVFQAEKFPFRLAITPYYLSLIDENNPFDPVRLQAISRIEESYISPQDMTDPLNEDTDSPTPGLTHRYPDRVLFFVTDQCSMYCRHCTRRRKAGEHDAIMPQDNINKAIEYIKRTPEIRDVILSGGDPLTLSDDKLDEILSKLYEIDHIDIIRIGTRIPVVLPQRVTEGLIKVLKKYPPIWLNTHFNHPQEITPEAKAALASLADNGVVIGNQSVLLRHINDNVDVMKSLVHQLVKNRVRPYYIYQCDLSEGISHFRTPVSKGVEIMESLRGHTSGLCIPTYVIDVPGGGGKIPVMPNYLISSAPNKVVLRNYEGFISAYTEPSEIVPEVTNNGVCREEFKSNEGVYGLIRGSKERLVPEGLKRKDRGDTKN